MTKENKQKLAENIKKDFEKLCDRYDVWCFGCPYENSTCCEIEYTLSYLNKRKKLKDKYNADRRED